MDNAPIFTISSRSINLIAEISAQLERYAIRMEQDDALLLRRINRVKTIHSSLAIEGNILSESQVSDILDGKRVIAPAREILEIRNAIKTYDIAAGLDPFSRKDLLKAHGVMMSGLVDDAGPFRSGNVGVVSDTRVIHVAPPARMVPSLIEDLLQWIADATDHMLVKSAVFHYEFEFIHPFSDGNGRTGRLWQSLLLAQWNPVLLHVPVENIVHDNQQEYYDAIGLSTSENNSGIFVEFMLDAILKALAMHNVPRDDVSGPVNGPVNGPVKLLLGYIAENPNITYDQMAAKLGKSRGTIRRYILKLKANGKLKRIGSDKNGHWKIC